MKVKVRMEQMAVKALESCWSPLLTLLVVVRCFVG